MCNLKNLKKEMCFYVRLTRDQEARDVLETNKKEFAEILKTDMSMKFDKLKQQLQMEQEKNKNLISNYNEIKLKMEQITQQRVK